MRALGAVAFVSLLLFSGTSVSAQGHGGGCSCGQFSSKPIPWEIEHTTSAFQGAAQAEFARWNNVAGLFTTSVGDGVVGLPNGKNEIVFLSGVLDPNTFGMSYTQPNGAFGTFNACPKPAGQTCGTFVEADVVINADFARGWTAQGPPDFDDNNGPAYYGATALHEIGHTLGLHHNFGNLSTMNYYEDYAAQYLAVADAAAIRQAYPAQQKAMTDIAVYPFYYDPARQKWDATTPVAISPTAIQAGSSFILDNLTVENVGTTSLTDVRLQVYLSQDPVVTTSDIFLGELTFTGPFPSLGFFDTSIGGPLNVPVGTSVPAGTYRVGCRVVINGSTEDQISYNNTFVAPQVLTITGCTVGGCNDANPCTVDDTCVGGQCQPGVQATAGTVSTLITASVNASVNACRTDKRKVVKKVVNPLVKAAKAFTRAEVAGVGTSKWTKKVSAGEKSIGNARSKLTKVRAKLSPPCVADLDQAITAGALADACLR